MTGRLSLLCTLWTSNYRTKPYLTSALKALFILDPSFLGEARYTTKMYLRNESLKKMEAVKEVDINLKAELFKREDVHNGILQYVNSLKPKQEQKN